jgi:hypothetical protein
MNVEIGTEAAQILFWEYLFRIFGIVSLQCVTSLCVDCSKITVKTSYWHKIITFSSDNIQGEPTPPPAPPNASHPYRAQERG